jgi:3-oxoacyl-[acyl-carrier protein] reductase
VDPARLDGEVAIVTGAARGVGLAVSETLARQGAAVCAADVLDLGAVTEAVAAHGARALAVPTDVSEAEQVTAMVDRTVAELGGLDMLVCCAAVYGAGGFDDVDESEWRRVLDVNLLGTYLCMQAAFGPMRERGGGRILTFGSVAGRTGGHASGPQYAASKGGIHAVSKWAANHGAPEIRVNVLIPGATDTEMIKGRGYPEDISPMNRLAQPAEIAEVAAFVVSKATSYMTGAVVEVNGGYLMT